MAELEAKRYLYQLKRKQVMIRTLEHQISRLEDAVHSPLKGVTYDRDVVQVSHASPGGNEKLEELVDMQARLKSLKASLIRDIDRVREEIWQIESPTYMELLSIIYLEGEDLQHAADRMKMSYDRTRHMHGEAILSFQRTVLDPRSAVDHT